MGLRGMLIGAGAVVIASVVIGIPSDGGVILLLGLVTMAGSLLGRIGSVVSGLASLATLAMVWLAFDRLVQSGRLGDAGLGMLLALLGALAGAVVGLSAAARMPSTAYAKHRMG